MEDSYGALVLAGGQGKRMGGVEKAALLCGEHTFLHRLEQALWDFPTRYLSTNTPSLAEGSSFVVVPDAVPGRGPLEGLRAALRVCREPALVVMPCDMPFFTAPLADFLRHSHRGGEAVVFLRDATGREHPLCGVYHRDCLPVLEAMLEQGECRVREACRRLGARVLEPPRELFDDSWALNVNTPAHYARVAPGGLSAED